MKKLCKIFVAALEKSAILYSLYYLYISKIKIGVAINIGKIEGKRAVVDNQRFNRGQNEGKRGQTQVYGGQSTTSGNKRKILQMK